METRKLYYEDCNIKEFSAKVTGCAQTERGWEVTLDATAFYPEGGGQPCDKGMIGSAQVMDVQERDGEIIHLCDSPLEPGTYAEGRINWQRRFRLMQQHAGEHIVSGIVNRLYGHSNVGFHMGKDCMEIDFSGPVPQEDLEKIETMANQVVWNDVPIKCWIPGKEELPHVRYRSKKALEWPVRIVEIPGADSCACCGVHTATTGQIGLIKILSCIKFKAGVRMELACGAQALEYMQKLQQQNRTVSQTLSAKVLETGAAAEQIKAALAEEKFRANGLKMQLFTAMARQHTGSRRVLRFEEGLSGGEIRQLADTILKEGAETAAVFSGSDSRGYQMCIVSRTEDAASLGNGLKETFSCRGGGKKDAFQGSISAPRSDLTAFFRGQWQA